MAQEFADAHTHMFNIRHIPVAEICYAYLKRWIGPFGWSLTPVCSLIQEVLVGLSYLPAAQRQSLLDEYQTLDEETLDKLAKVVSDAFNEIDEGTTQLGIKDLEAVRAWTERTAAPLALLGGSGIDVSELREEPAIKAEIAAITQALADDPPEQLEQGYDAASLGLIRKGLKLVLKLAMKVIQSIHGGLVMLLQLLGSEARIHRKYVKQFKDEPPFLSVNHAMDLQKAFGKWFLRGAHYRFHKRQIQQLSELIAETDGRTISFTAFDPRRKRRESKAILKDSIELGMCGVKYYPPLDYHAGENNGHKKRNKAFFKFCIDKGLPVFTHCTPRGFEREQGSGMKADPIHWQERLEMKGMRGLRLCFGHAGGGVFEIERNGKKEVTHGWLDPNWESANLENFAKRVVKLCREYEHVYCEVAYINELMGEESMEQFIRNLTYELHRDCDPGTEGPYLLRNKIMFGSDWHMPAMIGKADDYMRAFERALEPVEQLAPGFKRAFFSTNLLRYLDLPAYLARSKGFFDAHPTAGSHLAGLAKRDLTPLFCDDGLEQERPAPRS